MLRYFNRYFWQAQTRYRVHSPFVFRWLNEVLEDNRWYYAFSRLETLRREWSFDRTELDIEDLGAGSRAGAVGARRRVCDIARRSVSNADKCRFLFRNALFFNPSNKLELGTCLGMSALYQYFADTRVPLYTLEGSPALLDFAAKQFRRMAARGIEPVLGHFDQTLPQILQHIGRLDYAYIDGNHRGEATLRYFEQMLPYCHSNTVLIFDDIYWSDDMHRAWQSIKAHPRVRLSIDVFTAGLVLFRTEQQEVEHFTLIPARYKPWQMGFFR